MTPALSQVSRHQPPKRRNIASPSTLEMTPIYIGNGSELEEPQWTCAQLNMNSKQVTSDPLAEHLLLLNVLNTFGMTEIHIMVSFPKNKHWRATLFYSSPSMSQPRMYVLLKFMLNEETRSP